MRIWDVVDKVYPDIQITQVRRHTRRLGGMVSSAGKCVFAMHLVLASSGTFRTPMHASVSRQAVVTRLGEVCRAVSSPKPSGMSVSAPDELLTAPRGRSISEATGGLRVYDEPMLPVRSSAPPGERFQGRHGHLVVLKGK